MRKFAELRKALDEVYRIRQEIADEHPDRGAPFGAILQVLDQGTTKIEVAESLLYEVETR